jgi:hypothetical protein
MVSLEKKLLFYHVLKDGSLEQMNGGRVGHRDRRSEGMCCCELIGHCIFQDNLQSDLTFWGTPIRDTHISNSEYVPVCGLFKIIIPHILRDNKENLSTSSDIFGHKNPHVCSGDTGHDLNCYSAAHKPRDYERGSGMLILL